MLMLVPSTGTALGKLARARQAEREAAGVVSARPLAPVALTLRRVPGGTEAEAARLLVARVREMAAQGGVLVEEANPVPSGGSGLVRVGLRLSGPANAAIALVDQIEREAPLVRLRAWRVTALSDGGARLEGEAVAAWR